MALKQPGFREKLIGRGAELEFFDKRSQKRAEWLIEQSQIEEHLKKDGEYLDVGTGRGHVVQRILEDMDRKGTPLKRYYSTDIFWKPSAKVKEREKIRQGDKASVDNKNPMNFLLATSEALPIADQSLDGVSFIFSIHHMDGNQTDTVFDEAIRVLKKDGRIFIAEDLVETEEQRNNTEQVDRILNLEGKDAEHHYRSDAGWRAFFEEKGLEIVDTKLFESQSVKGPVQHGFYVLELKEGVENASS